MEFYLLTDIHSRFLVANPTPTPGGVSRLLVGDCRSSSLRFCTQGRGTGLITWPHRIPGPTSRDLPAQISSPLPEAPFLLILLPAPAELQGRPEALREERQPDCTGQLACTAVGHQVDSSHHGSPPGKGRRLAGLSPLAGASPHPAPLSFMKPAVLWDRQVPESYGRGYWKSPWLGPSSGNSAPSLRPTSQGKGE